MAVTRRESVLGYAVKGGSVGVGADRWRRLTRIAMMSIWAPPESEGEHLDHRIEDGFDLGGLEGSDSLNKSPLVDGGTLP